jgi:hypothetical protein
VLLTILAGFILAILVWVLSDDRRTQRLAVLVGRGRNGDRPPTA